MLDPTRLRTVCSPGYRYGYDRPRLSGVSSVCVPERTSAAGVAPRPVIGRITGRGALLWPVVLPGLVTAALGIFVLALPCGLTGIHGSISSNYGYDDGVYFAAAVRLLHGHLPYADFLFLHPPGITVLLAPAAVAAQIFGTPAGFVVARVATVAVSALNAALAASMLRHRGRPAALTAGLLFALYPAAVNATHTLLLEPYVVCCCLLGVNLLFAGGAVAAPRRVLLAGLALGVACTIKLTAVPVVVAAVLVVGLCARRALPRLTAGVVGAFGVVCLPFLLAAPSAFVSQVFLVQVQRREGGSGSLLYKLRLLTGAGSIETVHVADHLIVAGTVVFVACVGYRIVRSRRELCPGDWCVLAGLIATTAAAFSTGQFYAHYGYLPAAWIAMTAGLLVWRTPIGRLGRPVLAVLVAVACAAVFVEDTRHARAYLAGSFEVAGALRDVVPAGACLVTTFTTYAVVADRLVSTEPDCPQLIDPFGEWVAHTPRHRPYHGSYPAAFVADFAEKLHRADYVVFARPYSSYVPWTPELLRWYDANFTEIRRTDTLFVYRHRGHASPPTRAGAAAGGRSR